MWRRLESLEPRILLSAGDTPPIQHEVGGHIEAVNTDTVIGEVGRVADLTHESRTIVLSGHYTNPVVFAQPPSFTDNEPVIVRVADVQSDRFTMYLQEPPQLDGLHAPEQVTYVVLEAGTWLLTADTRLEVGSIDTGATVGAKFLGQWATVPLGGQFAVDPVVISQVQTTHDDAYIGTRQQNISAVEFQVALEQEESAREARSAAETIGYFAIEPVSGQWGQFAFEAGYTESKQQWNALRFDTAFDDAPAFIAGVASYVDADSVYVRSRALTATEVLVKVDEDWSNNWEYHHKFEDIGFLAFEGDGLLATVDGRTIGEVGQVIDLTHEPRSITLQRSYTNPVVLAQPPSFNDSDPTLVRITDVRSNRFTMLLQEPPNLNGLHGPEQVTYVVLESGTWRVGDGSLLEVGTVSTKATVGDLFQGYFSKVDFTMAQVSHDFGEPLNDGQVGLGTRNAQAEFDDFALQKPVSGVPLPHVENFDDSVTDFFIAQRGAWQTTEGTYAATPEDIGTDAISWLPLAKRLASKFQIDVTMKGRAGDADQFTNAVVIFDYHSSNDFKWAGAFFGGRKWKIGRYQVNGAQKPSWITEAIIQDDLNLDTDYEVSLSIKGSVVSLSAGGALKVSHDFDESLNGGQVGLGTNNALAAFDNFVLRELGAGVTLPYGEDFDDHVAEFFFESRGDWQSTDGQYAATPRNPGADTISWLPLARQLPAQYQIDVTMKGLAAGAGYFTNALVIFDYHGPDDFKWAGAFFGAGKWKLGRYEADGTKHPKWITDAMIDDGLNHNTDYDVSLLIEGNKVSLLEAGTLKLVYDFDEPLNDARVGLGTRNALAVFDSFVLHEPGRGPTFPHVEDFDDHVADYFIPRRGQWQTTTGGYTAVPRANGADTISWLPLADPLPADFQIDVTLQGLAGGPDQFNNAVVIFDYQGPKDFKWAGAYIGAGKWKIGRYVADGTKKPKWITDAMVDADISIDTEHEVTILIKGSEVILSDRSDRFIRQPVVMSQVQTANDDHYVTTRQRNVSTRGFEVALEEEEASHRLRFVPETVGYVAIEPMSGQWDQMAFEAGYMQADSNWRQLDFSAGFSTPPVLLADMASYVGSDNAHLRFSELTHESVMVKAEEDTTWERETHHQHEQVSYLAIGGLGVLTASPQSSAPAAVIDRSVIASWLRRAGQAQPNMIPAGRPTVSNPMLALTRRGPLNFQPTWLQNSGGRPTALDIDTPASLATLVPGYTTETS